jgi:hypothetical protein
MMKTTVTAMCAPTILALSVACSSAAPPVARETTSTPAVGTGTGETPAEAFDRECGASSRLTHVLEKPLASMGRTPEMAALLDGGLLVAGEREATSVMSTPTRSVVVVRLGSEGTVAWEISLVHPAGRLEALAVVETPDGGFAVLGRTELTREARSYGWLTKLSGDGMILWRDFFDETSGMDAGRTDRFLPTLAPYAFARMAVSDSGKLVLSGASADAATAEIDTIVALGKVTPGGGGSAASADAAEPAASLMDGGRAIVTTLRSEPLGKSCLKLRVLDADGKLRAEEPLAAEPQPGDVASIAAVGSSKVAVAFADVGALQVLVFDVDR